MKLQHVKSAAYSVLTLFALTSCAFVGAQTPTNTASQSAVWKHISEVLGRQGKEESPGVWKYDLTRDDLHVQINGVEIKPELALDGWLTFQGTSSTARLMGELVLTPDEIDAAVSKLQEGGVHIMALHNHLTGESPQVMYMHIMAEGEPLKIAEAIHAALALTKTPAQERENKEAAQGFDAKQIHRILGGDQEEDGGVLSFEIKRKAQITDSGVPVPPAMETSSEAKFQSIGNGKALTYGEIVLTAAEVNPVLRSLRQNGITVMALHNHMLAEQPRLFFIHCLGRGDALAMARAMRAALDPTDSEKPSGK